MATLIEMAAEIVSSHAGTTEMNGEELIQEIQKVYSALKALENGTDSVQPPEESQRSISVKEAFKKNEVICMICGKGGMKTLSRHLAQVHGLKPSAYRKQFGIPKTQPLTAKSLSQSRRQIAQERNLADNLAKARSVRAANIAGKKAPVSVPKKVVKPAGRKSFAKVKEA